MMFHTKYDQFTTAVTCRHCKESAMTEQVFLETTPLNALDRCDRCGAQAYVRAILLTGGELLFCAHHGKEYAEKLKTVAAKIQDESEKLVESK
jgi:ribosomal protein L37E